MNGLCVLSFMELDLLSCLVSAGENNVFMKQCLTIVTLLRRPSESVGGKLWFPDAHQLQHSPWFLYPDEA